MARISNIRLAHATTVLLGLAPVAGAGACNQSDQVYESTATLRLTTVTRQEDAGSLYDGCVVDRLDAPIPIFTAAPGDLVSEHVAEVQRVKRTATYHPGIDDHTNDAYWCGPDDNYGAEAPGSIGRADCYQTVGADPPAVLLSATLQFDSAMTVPIAVTRSLQVRHSGTLALAPDPSCPGPGLLPPSVDEFTILEQ